MRDRYRPELLLILSASALLCVGLVTIYSSSALFALERFGSSHYFLMRQAFWMVIALMAGFFFSTYDHRKLKSWVLPIILGSWILLVLVLFVGHEVGGAKRWIRFFGIGFQPSEFVKLALILFAAYYCDKKKSRMDQFWKGFFPFLFVVCLLCGLILLQPDLGTPVLMIAVCMTIAFLGGVKVKNLVLISFLSFVLAAGAIWASPYRRSRLLSFLDPWENPQGVSYQLVQSLIALGSGGLRGVGLGNSRSKLLYLPEPHTDFIFPILAEELGLAGSLMVLGLFCILIWAGFAIAMTAQNLFSRLFASGLTLLMAYQVIFNIAVVTGCLPTKGITLPFISFGGSSLVVTLACVGILVNISRCKDAR
jgi:cell division protein FtsW